MNLLLFDYNKAFLQVYDTFEEILKTNIVSENVRPLDIVNLIGHLNESFREFYLQNVYSNYTEFLIAYLAMIRSRPNKQILIKVCSDFILNWQKQVKKCCDLQLFLYIIHNNKDSKKLFEIYYYIRKTLFSYQTQHYRNNPLDMLQQDFEEANRLFRSLFSADLCKGICERFVALVQKHQKTIYKGNVLKGSFIAEFVLHEYLEIKEKQPELLKEVIIHNRMLAKEQNKYEFRKRFKINDSVIDYSPQQTGRNQGNKKFILDLSMLDHKKLGVEGGTQNTIQQSQKCLQQDCEHQQQIEVLLQRETSLVQENGELKQANQKIKNQLIESVVEIDSMKRNFDQMRVLTLSMIQHQQQSGNSSQMKESQINQEKASNISKQFDQVYLSVSQKAQELVVAKASQKKQYKKLTLNNSNFGQEDSSNQSLQPNVQRTEEEQDLSHRNKKQIEPQAPNKTVKSNSNSFLKLNQVSSEESFIKIKQTESTLTDNINLFKQRLDESNIIRGGQNKGSMNEIKESQREKSIEAKDDQGDIFSNLPNYSIHINGQSVKESNHPVNNTNQSPHFVNLVPPPENKNNFSGKNNQQDIPYQRQDRDTITSKSQTISNQSSIEDIYIHQVEESVGMKPNSKEIQESPIKQISLFQQRGSNNQQNQQGVTVSTKGRQEYSDKTENKKSIQNSVNIIDQHLNNISIDNSAALSSILDNANQTPQNNLANYLLKTSISTSQNAREEVPLNKDQMVQDKHSSLSRISRLSNNVENEVDKQNSFEDNNKSIKQGQSIGREDQIIQSARSTSQQSNRNNPYSSQTSQNNKRGSQTQNQNKYEVDSILQNQQSQQSQKQNSGRAGYSSSEKQSQNSQKHSSGSNSVERQKFPTFDEGQKMFSSSATKNSASNGNRNYSPTFNPDQNSQQQGSGNFIYTSERNQVDSRQKQNSIMSEQQRQQSNSITDSRRNQINNEDSRQNQNSQQSQRQNSNSIQDSKQKEGILNDQRSSNSIDSKKNNQNQQREEVQYTQTNNTNSSSQLSYLKSKGSMSGQLIESINLQNNQQQFRNEQQQINQIENQNNRVNSKRMSSIEGDIKPREFAINVSQNQYRGSVQLQNQPQTFQPFSKPAQNQQDFLDQSVHDSSKFDNQNKRNTFDIPEEEEIADENSDSNPYHSKTQSDRNQQKINSSQQIQQQTNQQFQQQQPQFQSLQQQITSANQQQYNKYLSHQNQQSDKSQQNKFIPNQRQSMQIQFNNNLQRQDSLNSSQSNNERTPENQNKKREFLSSSQKTGMNSSVSPFRKSMYASYQQNPTSGFKPSSYQQNSNQLLQYSATSNQSNMKANVSQFENVEVTHIDHEENSNMIPPLIPYQNPVQYSIQQIGSQNRSSLQMQKGDLNQSNQHNSRNSILNSQHNRSILTQKNEIINSALDTSQLSDNKSRNSQIIYNIQDSVNDFNNQKYTPRDNITHQKLNNVLQDIDSPMVVNSNPRNNGSTMYNPSNMQNNEKQQTFEGALAKHTQLQQQKWQQQMQQDNRQENRGDNQSEPDDVERQSDTWLRDSVIENDVYLNNDIKRDSKTKQTFGPFKMNTNQSSQDMNSSNPKPIFYGVPIAFQQTELVRKL